MSIKIYACECGTFKTFKNNPILHNNPVWSGVYLHGNIQDENGFDIVTSEHGSLDDGIYKCHVILHNGEHRKAKLFYWRSKESPIARSRGLIVALDDMEHLADAQRNFEERAEYI